MGIEPKNVIPLDQAREVEREGPRPLMREITPAEPYPVDTLGPLATAVLAIQEHTKAPPALVGQAVLGAASLGVQAHADVLHPATESPCPLSLFLFSIGESGERKTAVDALALRPVYDRQEQLAQQFEEARQEHEIELGIFAVQKKAAEAALKNGDATSAEADLRALGAAPEPPLAPLLICEEPTYEGLVKLSANGQPALGIFSSEGGAFIGGHGMSKDQRLKTGAGLSRAWDSGQLNRVRAGDGAFHLPGRRLAMHLMAQPEMSLEFLGARDLSDQGLFSRTLTAYPASTMGARLHRDPSAEARLALAREQSKLTAILERPPPLREGSRNCLTPRRLPLAPAAKTMALQFHDHVERQLREDGPLRPISGFANKAVEHAVRVAGVMALYEDLDADMASASAMEAALTLIQFYLAEQLRLRDLAAIPEHLALAQRLWTWIQRSWTEPMIHAAAVYQRGPGKKLRNRDAAIRTLRVLEEHGYVWPLDGGAVVDGQHRREAWGIWGRPCPDC